MFELDQSGSVFLIVAVFLAGAIIKLVMVARGSKGS